MPIEIKKVEASDQPTKRIPHKEILNRINVDEIEVKPFNTGVYSTVNLQDEIKKNLAEFAKRTGQPLREREERIVAPEKMVKEEVDTDISRDDTEEGSIGVTGDTAEITIENSRDNGRNSCCSSGRKEGRA